MNDGLVLLAAWLQWLALVAALAWAVARSVEGHHPRPHRFRGRRRRP